MSFDLPRVLRVLLFASPAPLSIRDIQNVFTRFHEEEQQEQVANGLDDAARQESRPEGLTRSKVPGLVTSTQIREAIEAINRDLEERSEVYRVQETHLGFRYVTLGDMGDWVRLLRQEPKPARLSRSALETLAIVAYRQPVTRAEIESIRGVSVDSALSRLLERDLIAIVGRAELPGRPMQYGTTEIFLEFLGLRSLEELPASDVLSHQEIDAWLKRDAATQDVDDSRMGLPEETSFEEEDTAVLDTAPNLPAPPTSASGPVLS